MPGREIVSLAEAKAARPNDQLSSAADALLSRCIAAASDAIERYCRRRFLTADYDVRHSGDKASRDKTTLYLADNARMWATLPVTAVAGVEELSVGSLQVNRIPLGAGAFTAGEGVVIDDDRGTVQRVSVSSSGSPTPKCWEAGRWNIRLQYTAGYALDAMPEDLVQAAIDLSWLLYVNPPRAGVESMSTADAAAQFIESLPMHSQMALDGYRFARSPVTVGG